MGINLLDHDGIAFFEKDLVEGIEKQIRLFEIHPGNQKEELGRIHLYDDRNKIQRHFGHCKRERAGFLTNHPAHGLIGEHERKGSSVLTWQENEGIRHSIQQMEKEELDWNPGPPKVRLTESGRIRIKTLL